MVRPRERSMTPAIVRFENVGLRYGMGAEVLRDVSFALHRGSFHFLSGPTGAGKTSLLKLMYLALRPTRGLISLFGNDMASQPRAAMPALRRHIGVVFQEFRLLDHLSVFDNVALPLRLAGAPPKRVQDEVGELLNWVGLSEKLQARPTTLSGGEQQRVAIARAVITRPRLLLADEPTGNLDENLAVRLLYLFEALNRLGTTIVIATHSKSLVRQFQHPVLMLSNGQLRLSRTRTVA
jgi:cell division transport system ATP-binding protein